MACGLEFTHQVHGDGGRASCFCCDYCRCYFHDLPRPGKRTLEEAAELHRRFIERVRDDAS